MSDYAEAPELYDLLYAGQKDYLSEAEVLASIIREVCPTAARVLDVACGTGEHARHLQALGFHVDGVDIEPRFVEIASAKCTEGTFRVADMRTLDLGTPYDVVLSLFSAIGYALTPDALRGTVERMASHLRPGGVLIVEPWFQPGQLTHGWPMMVTAESEDLKACRMSRTLIEGDRSILEFEYLIGRPTGLEHRSERHELGLFTKDQMLEAFAAAGLDVEHRSEGLRKRGLYVAAQPGAAWEAGPTEA